MNFRTVGGLGGEAAVRAHDDVFTADQSREAFQPLSDQFGVLDDIAGVCVITPGTKILPTGSLTRSQT